MMFDVDEDLPGMIVLACIWGITNTFIANATRQDKDVENTEVNDESNILIRPIQFIIRLIKNWRFTLPFLINQSASIVFLAYVIKSDLSKSVCTINSLTLIVTILSGYLIFNEPINGWKIMLGSILVLSGLYLMSNY